MKFIRDRECQEKTGIPRSTRYWLIKRGEFPAPVPLGATAVGWLESDLDDWMQKQIAKRDEILPAKRREYQRRAQLSNATKQKKSGAA